jgi:hypothetical protein
MVSLLVVAEVLDFVVVVIEEGAEVEFIVVLDLKLDGVAFLPSLAPEGHLVLDGIVVDGNGIPHVVAEGHHLVVLGRVDRRP